MTKRKAPEDKLKDGAKPFPYTEELADEICEAIATTHIGLDHLCKANPHWPNSKVIRAWTWKQPSFGPKYQLARERQQDMMVEYMMQKAEDASNDFYEDENGNFKPNAVAVSRAKLVVDSIKWQAGRLSRKYSDKSQVEVIGTTEKAAKEISTHINKIKKNERPY